MHLGLISNEAVGSMLPGYSKSKFKRNILAGLLTTSVKTKNVEGIKYYLIKTIEDNDQKTIWLNKNTLIPSEVTVLTQEGTKVAYNYDITFGNVKDEQVAKPNLEEYTLIENQDEIK